MGKAKIEQELDTCYQGWNREEEQFIRGKVPRRDDGYHTVRVANDEGVVFDDRSGLCYHGNN